MSQRPVLALIDGHALAFRAFHALRDAGLRSSTGEPTYAVYGFLQIMLTFLQTEQPECLAVAFDVGRTFRDDLYAEYKAGRAETPEEFHPQLERIKQAITALNVPIYTADGYEADDVIGTLARQAAEHGYDTLILTGDTDTLQLVDAHTQVVLANPYGQKTTTQTYDEVQVRERYKGLAPNQLADLRGLKGDASDNIPGVKGIGEAGAIALLNQFGTLEALYDRLDQAPKRYLKPLDGQREIALFSKRLATIVCDAPVQLDLQQARIGDYDRAAVIALFQELEIGARSNLIKKLPVPVGVQPELELPTPALAEPASQPPVHGAAAQLSMFQDAPLASAQPVAPHASGGEYQAITTPEQLNALIAELKSAAALAFDTETSGLDALQAELVGISLSTRPGTGYYLPLGHRTLQPQLPRETVLPALRPFFADPKLQRLAHNAKFDIEVLAQAGIEVGPLACDTMLAAILCGKRAGLKELAFYELRLPELPTSIEELIGRGRQQISFAEVPIERATPYAAADADMTLRLWPILESALEEQPRVREILTRLELPLIQILARMEGHGIGLDGPYLRDLGKRLGERLKQLEQTIYAIAKRPFNINSGDQLSDVLFKDLQLPTQGLNTTSTGRWSLTAEALERLQEHDSSGIIAAVLEYRQLTKLKSTYVDELPALINPQTGRVHTTYNQLGSATGRLSSNNPNLQNIPVRTEEGRAIRRAFVAAPGHRFIAADYSQIELRVLAHVTRDPNLLQAFVEGQDIHAATAAQLFSVPIKQVDKNQRRIAKTVVFGVIYGISAFGLAQRTDLSRSEAQQLIDALFARFPGIRTYIEQTLELGRRQGYVESLFGRRRMMPDLKGSGPRKAAAEREAINAPIQATAADIMKMAMIDVDALIAEQSPRSKLLLQVHDELILEVPDDEVARVQGLVRESMERVGERIKLAVPLRVDVETGVRWSDMDEV